MAPKVKAGSITHLTDARYFTSKGVEWLGFCFDPASPDFIEPHKVQEILGWVEGPTIVGEFNHRPADEIRESVMILNLKYIQLDADCDDPAYLDIDAEKIIKVPVAAGAPPESITGILNHWQTSAAWFVLQFEQALSVTEMEQWRPLQEAFPIIWQQPYNATILDDTLATLEPNAIAIRGGTELQTGEREFDELHEIFELLETEG